MKNWKWLFNARPLVGVSLGLVLLVLASSASAQYAVLLPKQTFSTGSLPNGWSAPYGYYPDEEYSGTWFWNSGGINGSGGAAMDDIWDYSSEPLTTPTVDASNFTAPGDSVWVDFDLFWEYNIYDYYDGAYDEFEIDGTFGEPLVSGTVATMYTYYNPNDYSFDATQSSSSDWQHYHILIPVSDRTSDMSVSFFSNPGEDYYGYSDAAVTNVTFTAYPPPPVPELSLTPKTLNFGTATPNSPDTMYATVQNVGALMLKITGDNLVGSAYSVISGPADGTCVPVGGSVQYGLQFQPFSNGVQTGTFTVITNGADSGTQRISLTGIGAVPEVSYSSNTMFRGVQVELTDTSAVQYLYVNSTGAGPLVVNSVSFIGLDARAYFITHLPASSIPPGGVDSIGVRFVPDIEGLPDAHMVINSTGVNQPWDTVLMYGVGILPHLAVSSANAITTYPDPLKVSFDSVKIGTDSCLAIVVSNPGSDTLAVEKNFFDFADPDFRMTPLTGRDTLIPPGGSQSIQVCFDPGSRGFRTATLRIVTNIPPTESKPSFDTSEYDVVIIGTGVPTGQLYISGPANGSTPVGKSVCVTDTIWNTGSATLTVTGVSIAGANASDFEGTYNPPLPFVLPANSSQTFMLCATPSDTGSQTALLTGFATSGETLDTATLNLSVYGTSAGDTVIITQPFAELTCQPGLDTATIAVMNTGNVSASYLGSIAGANANDFTILQPNPSDSEQAGGVALFHVVFNPTTTGSETANFVVTGGVGGSVMLIGTGGAATIAGNGTAPTTTIGTIDTFSVTVNNTGTCDWTPGDVAVNAPFSYLSGGNTLIPATGMGTLMFTFAPTSAGTFSSPVAFTNSTGVSIPAANVVINGTASSAGVLPVSAASGYSLDQNYPNPFNDESNLEITLAAPGLVQLSIVDVQGNVVENVLNRQFDAGTYSVTLSAEGLASGTYYYQMSAGGVTLMRQMVIVK